MIDANFCKGGQATIMKARCKMTERKVVVKMYVAKGLLSQIDRKAYEEANILKQLKHDNIV